MKLVLCQLYPEHLSIYADRGNVQVSGGASNGAGSSSRSGRCASASRSTRRPPTST